MLAVRAQRLRGGLPSMYQVARSDWWLMTVFQPFTEIIESLVAGKLPHPHC